jgi:hypothetical protein
MNELNPLLLPYSWYCHAQQRWITFQPLVKPEFLPKSGSEKP